MDTQVYVFRVSVQSHSTVTSLMPHTVSAASCGVTATDVTNGLNGRA